MPDNGTARPPQGAALDIPAGLFGTGSLDEGPWYRPACKRLPQAGRHLAVEILIVTNHAVRLKMSQHAIPSGTPQRIRTIRVAAARDNRVGEPGRLTGGNEQTSLAV